MSKYNIPAEYERYSSLVETVIDDYTRLIEEDLVTFETSDIMVLIGLLGKTINKLRETVDEMKGVADTDKVSLFGVILGIVLEKSIMASDKLTEDQKAQVQSAFGENGLFQSLLGMFNQWFNKKLKSMDTNKDNKVTRAEYVEYLFRQNKKNCPCVGDAANRRSAECSANCCFPFLSGGDGIIDLENAEANVEVEVDVDPEPLPEPESKTDGKTPDE